MATPSSTSRRRTRARNAESRAMSRCWSPLRESSEGLSSEVMVRDPSTIAAASALSSSLAFPPGGVCFLNQAVLFAQDPFEEDAQQHHAEEHRGVENHLT